MKKILSVILFMSAACPLLAQRNGITGDEWADPSVPSRGAVRTGSEFLSYDTRETAEKGSAVYGRSTETNRFYMPLKLNAERTEQGSKLSATAEIPFMWLDRDLFLQVEGVPSYYVAVNGRRIGYGEDNRTPSRFRVSDFVTDGANTFTLEIMDGGTGRRVDYRPEEQTVPAAFLFSQPKVRIEDYEITACPDSTNSHGILTIRLFLSNSYNSAETATVGYDIYSPQGKLQHYDIREVSLTGQGRDTVEFSEFIYGTPQNLWSASSPKLYHGMLTVKREGRMVEYIPYNVGFVSSEISGGTIVRNGADLAVNAVRYNAAADPKEAGKNILHLKAHGVNTVIPDYPQPVWFYDLCDREGMYIIEQANVNPPRMDGDRNVGGTLGNDPAWQETFRHRMETAYSRIRNHTCIVGWSLGGDAGNGYNMYKSYLWMKGRCTDKPVIYNDCDGEWNSDMERIPLRNALEILALPLPDRKPAAKPAGRK